MKLAILPVTPYQQNCSLVVCRRTNRAALVDPGGEVDRLLAAVANALDQLRRGGPRWTIEESLANALARAKAQGSVS